ncbi:serine/threonine protein kinase [Raineyella antarctica]|uniref:non-specific serine/threonine protein kinase n=1 Tax=Raineyella antarctica TaxID=1577474 RepID=A0A1G6GEV2_9ACTN|nr:Stk1 family PASTA domain-containing Ser/Thr kinase [Raineyella antarctica]SDB80531.1 serine/threonine protein kinase [Raineyella antarctica]
MDTQPRILGGRYQLGPTLGRGGMAEVNRARDLRLQREVAIKQLRVDLASDPTFQERFRREAHSAAGLNHPNIVAVYDTDEERNEATGEIVPYIVMELVEGRTLRQVLNSGDMFTSERALEITQGVLDALGYSHRAGIVHRDIKPGNVMLTDAGGVVKVMDFGIARAVADTQATMTQTAAVIGTAQYLSPEQARGEKVGFRSDLYSTGCLLYELLTGRPPFTGDSPVSVAYQHVREQAPAPSTIVPTLGPDLDAVLLKSLEKSPDRRYQTAREFQDDLARILAGQHPLAAQEGYADAAAAGALGATAVAGAAESGLATRAILAVGATEAGVSTTPQRALVDSTGETSYVDDDARRRRRRRAWWTVLAVVLAALVIGGGVWWANGGLGAKQVAVPDVVTKSQVVAEELLRAEGLEPSVTSVEGPDDATVGRVTAQDPAGGTQVDTGSKITLTVNAGPKKLQVPDGLVGRSLDEARSALSSAGFTNIRTVAADSTEAANTVLSVEPASGTQIVPSQQVVLTYASGRVTLPDWKGFNRQAVESAAKDLGLTNVKFTTKDSSATAGTVLSQSPGAGTNVGRDAAVTVVLAAAPQPTAAPTTASAAPTQTQTPTAPAPTPTPTPTATTATMSPGNSGSNPNSGSGNNSGNANNSATSGPGNDYTLPLLSSEKP